VARSHIHSSQRVKNVNYTSVCRSSSSTTSFHFTLHTHLSMSIMTIVNFPSDMLISSPINYNNRSLGHRQMSTFTRKLSGQLTRHTITSDINSGGSTTYMLPSSSNVEKILFRGPRGRGQYVPTPEPNTFHKSICSVTHGVLIPGRFIYNNLQHRNVILGSKKDINANGSIKN
jgi:hypothetical protein